MKSDARIGTLRTTFLAAMASLFLMVSVCAAQAVAPIIPKPVSYTPSAGTFTVASDTSIYVQGQTTAQTDEIYKIGQYLAGKLSPSTGYAFNVVKSSAPPSGSIYLTTIGGSSSLGNEGYTLSVSASGVNITAYTPEGLFRGIQSVRQMLPPDIEKSSLVSGVAWDIPYAAITDYPAYSWRSYMLDPARYFYTVDEVKRHIDLMAQYKMNIFHLHLTDDQGWRIQINSWPNLTLIGGSTQTYGGPGGYYTQAQYTDIINYAKDRYITVIPEIEMPGHCNAALASYGVLNPDGQPKPLYTGVEVGFSTFMIRKQITYDFIDDVIREVAALTPGEYIHIGGDEAYATKPRDYNYFIGRASTIVASHGKKMMGWTPSLRAELLQPGSMMQLWSDTFMPDEGFKLVLSPASKTYLDLKYNSANPVGGTWAGYNPTDDSYQWDPTDFAAASAITGVEAALWAADTNMEVSEYQTYPRLPGHAEVGWTPKGMRSWDEYKLRLVEHGLRMANQGILYYRDPVVPWHPETSPTLFSYNFDRLRVPHRASIIYWRNVSTNYSASGTDSTSFGTPTIYAVLSGANKSLFTQNISGLPAVTVTSFDFHDASTNDLDGMNIGWVVSGGDLNTTSAAIALKLTQNSADFTRGQIIPTANTTFSGTAPIYTRGVKHNLQIVYNSGSTGASYVLGTPRVVAAESADVFLDGTFVGTYTSNSTGAGKVPTSFGFRNFSNDNACNMRIDNVSIKTTP